MYINLFTFTLHQLGNWLINYLDDFVGVAPPPPPTLANSHFTYLVNILEYVYLPINTNKVENPSNQITCLGIRIDASTGILKVPEQKMLEMVSLCKKWATYIHSMKN